MKCWRFRWLNQLRQVPWNRNRGRIKSNLLKKSTRWPDSHEGLATALTIIWPVTRDDSLSKKSDKLVTIDQINGPASIESIISDLSFIALPELVGDRTSQGLLSDLYFLTTFLVFNDRQGPFVWISNSDYSLAWFWDWIILIMAISTSLSVSEQSLNIEKGDLFFWLFYLLRGERCLQVRSDRRHLHLFWAFGSHEAWLLFRIKSVKWLLVWGRFGHFLLFLGKFGPRQEVFDLGGWKHNAFSGDGSGLGLQLGNVGR